MQVKHLILCLIIATVMTGCGKSVTEIMALTGATPLAYGKAVPEGFTFAAKGLVKKEYEFSSSALRALATTCLRTREVNGKGDFLGTYAYTGIPVIHLLEGIAPAEPKKGEFDRPLDMVVTFVSSTGKSASFSYGELAMADDSFPVILAFDRRGVRPTKDADKGTYDKNVYKDNLKAFRLVCPGDKTDARYLDDVAYMKLERLPAALEGTPKMVKGMECGSKSLACVNKGATKAAVFAGVPRLKIEDWVKVGHGRGYKGISQAKGYHLASFLKSNFPGCGAKDFFMFIGCDGYRSIFSGAEIFESQGGSSMMILDEVDGKEPEGGLTLGPVKDYYVDRCIHGLSHVVIVSPVQ